MNTAPHEDIEMEDEVLTPEDWRDIEAHFVEAKNQLHNLIAVYKPTGQFAGPFALRLPRRDRRRPAGSADQRDLLRVRERRARA